MRIMMNNLQNELCGVILVNKHKGVTSHDYSLLCVKGGGPLAVEGLLNYAR